MAHWILGEETKAVELQAVEAEKGNVLARWFSWTVLIMTGLKVGDPGLF